MKHLQRCSIKSVKFKDVPGFPSFLTGCWAPRVSLPLSLCFNFLIRCVLYILSVIFLCTCMEELPQMSSITTKISSLSNEQSKKSHYLYLHVNWRSRLSVKL